MNDYEFYCSEFFEHVDQRLRRRQGPSRSSINFSRRFRSYLGTSSKICCFLWAMVKDSVPVNCRPAQLLWALMFLKNYSTENVNASVDEKSFRKSYWIIVKELSRLYSVSILFSHGLPFTYLYCRFNLIIVCREKNSRLAYFD